MLSLLGITIGIFSIISVFTMVDTLENDMRDSIESLGDNVVMIQKWPFAPEEGDEEYAWWKYCQRPEPIELEAKLLKERLATSDHVAFQSQITRTVERFNNFVENVQVSMVNHDYSEVINLKIAQGRYFSNLESTSGKGVVLLGADIADKLFPDGRVLGKAVKIGGAKVDVIGVFERSGDNILGSGFDQAVVVPIRFGKTLVDFNSMQGNKLLVKAKLGVSNAELKDEVTGALRAIRRQRPKEEKSFAVIEPELISNLIDDIIGFINTIGWVIGGFSILVGGFSIANIMFVSVKERTGQIGIQKALGAKNNFILTQFLAEAIILSLIGGAIGLCFIYIGTLVAGAILEMDIVLTLTNVLIGLGLSVSIGLVSGIIPAWMASQLDPVEAMRSS